MKRQTTTPQNGSGTSSAQASKSKTAAPRPSSQTEVKISGDDIRRRAYEIYLNRQTLGRDGCPETDWAEAERELKAS